ncbi:ATP-grasp domain-containing protein [Candidatus Nomurabacteria bacterium]|nr:ATP-grasp domain-containing protein [Candidatus Nomurabacteria bacterium]
MNDNVKFFLDNFSKIENNLKSKKIYIFFGGFGEEREASLYSGEAVKRELLLNNNWQIEMIDPSVDKDWVNRLSKNSIVFNCLHGTFGESGHLASILDYLDVDYTFSDVYTSVVSFDKLFFKGIVNKLNVNTPLDNFDLRFSKVKKNLFVHKKIRGGGSIDLNINGKIFDNYDQNFTEVFVAGKILTVGVLESCGNYNPLSIVEIIMKNSQFYDKKAKYEDGFCEYKYYYGKNKKKIFEKIRVISSFLKIKGGARFDLIESKNGEVYFLEVNSVPGLYSDSNFIYSALGSRLNFYQVLIWLLNNARHNIYEI